MENFGPAWPLALLEIDDDIIVFLSLVILKRWSSSLALDRRNIVYREIWSYFTILLILFAQSKTELKYPPSYLSAPNFVVGALF